MTRRRAPAGDRGSVAGDVAGAVVSPPTAMPYCTWEDSGQAEGSDVSWLVGFALGALGGFILGCLKGPAALSGLRYSTGQLAADSTGSGGDWEQARRRRGKRLTGLLLDEQLARLARRRLAERGLTNPRVDVTIVDAVAYLRGRVPSAADAAAIAETVKATPGLAEVVNELKLPEAAAS